MFEKLQRALLPILRVPPEPDAPLGAPGSIRVFRAGRNFYKFKLFVWGVGQLATIAGIVFSLGLLSRLKSDAEAIRQERAAVAQASVAKAAAPNETGANVVQAPESGPQSATGASSGKPRMREMFWHDPHNPVGRLIDRSPWWLFPLITFLEFVGVVAYLLQLPVTFALLRLEFDAHWYIVTDRSLRIRTGLITMREATMSFANVQQVTVSENPIQRLLGIADVRVQSAGGGRGGDEKGEHDNDSMHTGVFHGVDNASEIRDLILERLRQYRAAGLGDPDEHPEVAPTSISTAPAATTSDVRAAARTMLDEARALRATLT